MNFFYSSTLQDSQINLHTLCWREVEFKKNEKKKIFFPCIVRNRRIVFVFDGEINISFKRVININ